MSDQQDDRKQQAPGLTAGRVFNLVNQGIESLVSGTIALPALVADGYVNIFRAARQALGGKNFEASSLYDNSKETLINTGRKIDGSEGKVVGAQNTTEKAIVFSAEILGAVVAPGGLANATKTAATTTLSATKTATTAAKTSARVEPTLEPVAAAARTAVDDAAEIAGQSAGKVNKTFDPRAAKATEETATKAAGTTAKEAGGISDDAITGLNSELKAMREELKDGLKKAGSKSDAKANAGWGERAKNYINSAAKDSNVFIRTAAYPLAWVTGKMVSNPIKTGLAADLAVNATSASLDSAGGSVTLRAAEKKVDDVAAVGIGLFNGTAWILDAIGAEEKATALVKWGAEKGPEWLRGGVTFAGDVAEGVTRGVAKQAGVNPDTLKLPTVGGGLPSKIARESHNHRVDRESRIETSLNDGSENGAGETTVSTRDRAAAAAAAAHDKGADAAEEARRLAEKAKDAQLMKKAGNLLKENPLAGIFGLMGFAGGEGVKGRTMGFAIWAILGTLVGKLFPGLNDWVKERLGDSTDSLMDMMKDGDEKPAAHTQTAGKKNEDVKVSVAPTPTPVLTPAAVAKVADPAVAASNDATKHAQNGAAAAMNGAGKPIGLALAPVGNVSGNRLDAENAARYEREKQLSNGAPSMA